jgi:phosphopantetheinyl transferase
MIYCVLCDISAVRDTSGALAQTSAYGISRAFLGTGTAHEKRRAAAYSALGAVYERLSATIGRAEKLPSLSRDLVGKPRFTSACGVFKGFSISYSGELVAIALSDTDGALGVDIESERQLKNPEKIENRLCGGVCEDLGFIESGGVSYYLVALSTDGRMRSFVKIPDASLEYLGREKNYTSAKEKRRGDTETPLLQKWTLTEALLKADGGGFCSIQDIDRIKSHALCESVSLILNGKRIYTSVAVKN